MSSITIEANKQEIQVIKARYPLAKIRKTPPYAIYQIELSDCVITAYASGKVVFQGEGAAFHTQGFQAKETKQKKAVKQRQHEDEYPQCGSDEVGTGDYFGPVCVCAAYVKKEDVAWLQDLQIQDSKAMNDAYIREIAPALMKRLIHSLLILDNATYNQIHPTNNMVAIKCKLHNKAFVHLQKKVEQFPSFIVIDQFVQGTSYYRYLKYEKEVIHDIHFETKAENKYMSVACGSIIARYAFLKAFDAMCEQYDFTFLKGAGNKVDINIQAFVERYGKEALSKVAKVHFANTKKAGIV